MTWLHTLVVNDQGYVETGGFSYGPYDALTLLWQGERLAVVHCKGHTQYWGQSAHYIAAHVLAFEKMDTNEQGGWLVREVNSVDTGRASRRVKAEMIAWAKEKEEEYLMEGMLGIRSARPEAKEVLATAVEEKKR